MKVTELSPRRAAWEVLSNFNAAEHNCAELVEKFGEQTQNRASLVDIAFGIIRNSVFIDKLISLVSVKPLKNIPEKILNCLRIAVYELVFTSQADYAIVNEAVNLTKAIGSKKAAGFVNAVLRKMSNSIKNKTADLSKADLRKTLPLSPAAGCEFNIDILPDADKQAGEYLSCAFSLPLWLIEQWLGQYGFEKTKNICFASNRRPSVYARPNKLKINAEKLFGTLKSQEVDCEVATEYKMVRINKSGNIAGLESFKAGLFTIQDLTSSSVAALLNPQPGWKILDICAAPGTKTTQIAELTGDKGVIIATDIDSSRLGRIGENIRRLGITSVKILSYEDFLKEAGRAGADAVLLDVPCSNTGVLAKRPEVRLRLDKKRLEEIVKIQIELLEFASPLVKKGGKICYSTCSILNQENSDVVNNFINKKRGFVLEQEKLILPCAGTWDFDGGYAAILVKT
jgi:16S rRNA (cytosine967-C5)-methyltransferase